jgi:CDP-4-dehydro-6-deoxyglucose reductase
MFLQFHLARRADEPFTMHVFERLRQNDVIDVTGPFGDFTLDESSPRPLVMVAQDTGFAPVKSLLEHVIALELPQPLTLVWASAFEDGFYMANLCRSWGDALDNFTYQPLFLEADGEVAAAAVIASTVAKPAQCDFYLATGAPLRAGLLNALAAYGARAERIFVMEKRQCGMR